TLLPLRFHPLWSFSNAIFVVPQLSFLLIQLSIRIRMALFGTHAGLSRTLLTKLTTTQFALILAISISFIIRLFPGLLILTLQFFLTLIPSFFSLLSNYLSRFLYFFHCFFSH